MMNQTIKELKLGFIGFGNMAQAMADGFLRSGILCPDQIYACARNWEKLCDNTGKRGMHACRSAEELVKTADLVVVAVKPYQIKEVLEPIREILKGKIVLSVAAGCPFSLYETLLLPGTEHISTIPNTPVSICEGIFVCENRHSLSDTSLELVTELLSALGLVQMVETSQLSIAGTICGCGPAFVSIFMEAMADAAVMHGIPRAAAYAMVSQMTAGTGKLQLASGQHPGVMKDAVCSPGGTTIIGVAELERAGLRSAVIQAVNAIERR